MNTAVCMRHDVQGELRRVDWAEVGIRLTAYASWKARNLRWRTGRVDDLAGGKTPEDLAAEAILKVLTGERAWDPARGALLPYLEGVVDSLMSHLAASPDNRMQEKWSDTHGETAAESQAIADPEDRIARLRAVLLHGQQHALLAVLDAVANHVEPKPQAIAQHLGTTVADINNRLKRLRRCAQQVMQQASRRRGVGSARR